MGDTPWGAWIVENAAIDLDLPVQTLRPEKLPGAGCERRLTDNMIAEVAYDKYMVKVEAKTYICKSIGGSYHGPVFLWQTYVRSTLQYVGTRFSPPMSVLKRLDLVPSMVLGTEGWLDARFVGDVFSHREYTLELRLGIC